MDEDAVARTGGYASCTDDPAWEQASSIALNEHETFGVEPRSLEEIKPAYNQGEAPEYWERVEWYLVDMGGASK